MRTKIIIFVALLQAICTSAWAIDFNFSSKSYILIEAKTGQVLLAKNENMSLPPASTTKILTAIMAIEQRNVDRKIRVSPKAASVGEASIYLEPGEQISVLSLIKGALIRK